MLPLPSSLQVSPASTPKNVLHHAPPLSRQSREGSCDTGTGQSNTRCLLQGKQRHAQRRNTRRGQGSSGFLRLLQGQRGTTMPGWVRPDLGGPLRGKGHQGWPPGAPGESEAASSQHWGKRTKQGLSPGQARNQPLAGPASAWKWFPTSRLKSRIGGITSPISQVQLPPPHCLQPLLTTSAKLKETVSRQCPSVKLPGEWASGAKGLHIAKPCPSSPQPCSYSLWQGHTVEMRAGGKLCLPFWLSSAQQRAAPQPQDIHAQRSLGEAGMG